MKKALGFAVGLLSSTFVVHGKTIVTGCVTDSNGRAVAGVKVFAAGDNKVFHAETHKNDGCYEMRITRDGVYTLGIREKRFDGSGLPQRDITVAGLDIPDVNLSTDVPNKKQITDTVTKAVLSASKGFGSIRKGLGRGDVPVIEAEVPSGFSSCMIQSHTFDTAFPERMPNGPTVMWYCAFGGGYTGIRDEEVAHAMFETIREAITTSLASVEQLHYSSRQPVNRSCYAVGNAFDDCVEQRVWASPINGVLTLTQTQFKSRNGLVLWAAYNSPMTEAGCASIQKNENPTVDVNKYESAMQDMHAEYARQLKAALHAELGNVFGAAVGGPGFIHSAQQPGMIGESAVSPNACLLSHALR